MPGWIVRPLPVAPPGAGGFSRPALYAVRGETDKTIAWRAGRSSRSPGDLRRPARQSNPAPPMRKALCAMTLTQQSSPRPRRLRAALIGLGLDNADDQNRVTRGDQSLIFGGSAETHAELWETALRMELELDRQGLQLGDLDPSQLAEL